MLGVVKIESVRRPGRRNDHHTGRRNAAVTTSCWRTCYAAWAVPLILAGNHGPLQRAPTGMGAQATAPDPRLPWPQGPPGQPGTISASRDPRLVTVQAGGPDMITRDGHLRLPARIRHACKLSAGERLFVTVTAAPPVVAVYPMATIETIIGQQRLGSASTIAVAP
jgi:hypothetical protein